MAPHDKRPDHKAQLPVLITARLRAGLPSLRHASEAARIRAALALANELQPCMQPKHGKQPPQGRLPQPGAPTRRVTAPFQVVHHSIQTNHLHLIVEAPDRATLSASIRGLLARIARMLNRLWKRNGSVFADRFHERELSCPRQVRNALVYVLQNSRKHEIYLPGPDPFSSSPEFDGWKRARKDTKGGRPHPESHAPDADESTGTGCADSARFRAFLRAARIESPSPRTWLLATGWRRHGLIDPAEIPRGH